MKVLYIGNIIDVKKSNKDYKYFSIADNYMQIKFLNELYQKYKENLELITINYENFRERKIGKFNNVKTTFIKSNIKNVRTYYINFMLCIFKEIIKYLKRYKKEKIVIITNGPYFYYSVPVIVAKFFYKFKYVCYMICSVDLPQYKGIYKLVASMSKHLIKKCDGTITYVEKTSLDYTKKPYCVLNYQIDELKVQLSNKYKKHTNNSKNIVITYTGALNEIYGVTLMLELISKLPDNFKLKLCGDGEGKEKVLKFQKQYPNKIEYLGILSMEKSMKLQFESDILLCLKTDEYYNKYAGTSKINEYLLSKTPILVNNHESLNNNIKPYLNLLDNTDIKYMTKEIISFSKKLNSKSVLDKCVKGREYIINNCMENSQSQKLGNFIDKVS